LRKKFVTACISRSISRTDTDMGSKTGGSHRRIVRTARADAGQAMAEYAVILTFIAAAVIVTYQLFGAWVAGLFDSLVSAL
jgi:Flp pilus assembly pilin Flp